MVGWLKLLKLRKCQLLNGCTYYERNGEHVKRVRF